MEERRHTDHEILTTLAVLTERFANFEQKLEMIHKQTLNTNDRVSTLEVWRATLTGKMAVLATVAGLVASVVVAFITKKVLS